MSEAYKKIAEGLKLMAEGYEALAVVDTAAVPEPKEPKKTGKKTSVKEQVAETQKDETTVPPAFDRDTVLAEIRAVMSPKCKEGKTEQCQALLKEYGVPNLSNIPDDKLLEFKARAEVL